MQDDRGKTVLEERISTVVGGKVVEGFRRVLQVSSRSHLHQEVVYLGFYLGDVAAYQPSDQVRMLDGAKRLLWEIASGNLHRRA